MKLQTILNTYLTEEYKNTTDLRQKKIICRKIYEEVRRLDRNEKKSLTELINPFTSSNLDEFSFTNDNNLNNYFIIPVTNIHELIQELKNIKNSFSFERQKKLKKLHEKVEPGLKNLIEKIKNSYFDSIFVNYMFNNNISKVAYPFTTVPEVLESDNIDDFLEKEFYKILPDEFIENDANRSSNRIFLEEIPQGMPIILHSKKLYDNKFNLLNIGNRQFSSKLKNEILKYIPGARTARAYIIGYLALPGKTTEEVIDIVYKLEKLTYDRKTLSQSKYKTAAKELANEIGPIDDIYNSFYLVLSGNYKLDTTLNGNSDTHSNILKNTEGTDFLKRTFGTNINSHQNMLISEIKQKIKNFFDETYSKKIEIISENSRTTEEYLQTYILDAKGR